MFGEATPLVFLTNAEAITVLAPTDQAFDLLPNGTVESLLLAENHQRLVEILSYHVVGASLSAKAVKTLSSGETLSGQKLAIVNENDGLFLNDAKVITKDISVANGVVHTIDRVLLPPTQPTTLNFWAFLANDGRFTTLMVAAEAAGFLDSTQQESFPLLPELNSALGPVLVSNLFAPTGEAFSRLPEGTVETLLLPGNKGRLQEILLQHVVSG